MDMPQPPERPERPPASPFMNSLPVRLLLAFSSWMERHRRLVVGSAAVFVVGLQALSVFLCARDGLALPLYVGWVTLQIVADTVIFFPLSMWMQAGLMGLALREDLLPKSNDGAEQIVFESWACREGYDMTKHPLHWLFLNPKTYAARQGWKAGIEHCRRTMGVGGKP